jgi:hypothetical protein
MVVQLNFLSEKINPTPSEFLAAILIFFQPLIFSKKYENFRLKIYLQNVENFFH